MKELPKVYLARAGSNGEDEDYALENGLAIIGFRDFGSLEHIDSYEDIVGLVRARQPDWKPAATGICAGQLWRFAIGVKEGDTVVLPRKLTSQIALGKVAGPYHYREIREEFRHARPVKWIRPDVPRTAFQQDLLYSLGAAMTVCNISRNEAERRIAEVLAGKVDPGLSFATDPAAKNSHPVLPNESQAGAVTDLAQLAHDQIVAHIQSRFSGHALTRLVDAVLQADGWATKVSPPGADGGVDVLAGRGTLGLDQPRLCVQVKSQNSPADVSIYRGLQGSMQSFKAEQGLLVCWGGFNKPVLQEAKQSHFTVRLWESRDLVEAIFRNYERLPAEIQAELPLKKVWTLVPEETPE